MIEPAYLVGAGAVVGALSRYETNRLLHAWLGDSAFPAGTFTVNVIGSFILGFVTFLGVGDAVLYAVGTGACGSYTTFSSFSVDTVQLWEEGRRALSVLYASVNLGGALAAIGLAWVLVSGF
ncbi:fluoride efflux transporter CrcB [Halospeciosus flavus]|uniref:Fluoride-specific ion channel FluC n=1 Tax=Halospeciosus flavus TaxID=3032283 RepID=A0ABD5Z3B5_9EURY|nr:fluoride efflux transporter CrcB [Halospeciosus flavus]